MARKNRRKAMRSGNFPCDICGEFTPLVEHHIAGRDVQSPNAKGNLAYICPTCHDCVHLPDNHRDKIELMGWFRTSDGWSLEWVKPNCGDVEPHSDTVKCYSQ